ncbi:hypothetical protein [Cupriavidus metallidurans]|uniref:Uncharacterized protein n=1 Tax=Cupriavidus metallidurans TaxID=119219 RepID=A0A482IPH9_9BURK|nr:hypothetical protein [Cupriavidus metallidurans]QBP09832.1 hypothetical protein DDF84_008695 [Cupriavidus metallidurans]
MTRRNWKRIQPTSLRQALELCKDFARERHNRSVERIAEQMGIADHWTVYKWLQTGRIPLVMVRPFEAACGIDFATRWLAASGGKLLIDIPTGRSVQATDVQELQSLLNTAVGAILAFADGTREAEQTLADIESGMGALAWHRGNIHKHTQPDLDLIGA